MTLKTYSSRDGDACTQHIPEYLYHNAFVPVTATVLTAISVDAIFPSVKKPLAHLLSPARVVPTIVMNRNKDVEPWPTDITQKSEISGNICR